MRIYAAFAVVALTRGALHSLTAPGPDPDIPNKLPLLPCTSWAADPVFASQMWSSRTSIDADFWAKGTDIKIDVRVLKVQPLPLSLVLNISGDNGLLSTHTYDLCKTPQLRTVPAGACCGGSGLAALAPGNFSVYLPPAFMPPVPKARKNATSTSLRVCGGVASGAGG